VEDVASGDGRGEHLHTHTYPYIYTHTLTHKHTHKHTNIYTHTHTHTHDWFSPPPGKAGRMVPEGSQRRNARSVVITSAIGAVGDVVLVLVIEV
jgi:hypothetical protein